MRIAFIVATGLLVSTAAAAQAPTAEAQNEQVVRRYYEAMNRGDAKAAAAEFATDAKNFGRPVGRQGIEDRLVDIFTTFPDWHMEIVDIVASGDDVIVRARVTGTHRGVAKMPLNNMPVGAAPTGKRFEVSHIHWHTLQEGQIVEHYANRDDLGMLRQLDLLSVAAAQRGERMNWDAIGAIGSIVGSVAVVCTLAYLALQMKQNTKALTTSTYETAMGGFNEVIGFLNNDPTTSSLMRRGWIDPNSLSVDETYRFTMLVRYYSNHVYKLFRLYEGGVFPAHEWKRTAREAVQFFYLLPAGVAFREKNQYYEDLWSELVRHEGASISDFSFGTHEVSGRDNERSKT